MISVFKMKVASQMKQNEEPGTSFHRKTTQWQIELIFETVCEKDQASFKHSKRWSNEKLTSWMFSTKEAKSNPTFKNAVERIHGSCMVPLMGSSFNCNDFPVVHLWTRHQHRDTRFIPLPSPRFHQILDRYLNSPKTPWLNKVLLYSFLSYLGHRKARLRKED